MYQEGQPKDQAIARPDDIPAGIVGEAWWYPLAYGDTLSNHDWIPLHINRLLTSQFVAHACAEDRRGDIGTALILWAESFKQDPAGTLPDDEVTLAQIARFGADLEAWRAVRDGALHGWRSTLIENAEPGDLPRLGHATIARIACDMHKRKRGRDVSREVGRLASMRNRVKKKLAAMGGRHKFHENREIVEAVAAWLDQSGLYVTDENVRLAMTEAVGVAPNVEALTPRKAEGSAV